MHRMILAAGLSLAACAPEPSAEDQARLDERAIAEVEAAQIPPPEVIVPGTIDAADVQRHDMQGAGCAYLVAGEGAEPVAILLARTGYMKIDGRIEQFAADAGSGEGALGTRATYDSGRHSLSFDLLSDEGTKAGSETVEYPARVTLRDGRDRLVYESKGRALCGA